MDNWQKKIKSAVSSLTQEVEACCSQTKKILTEIEQLIEQADWRLNLAKNTAILRPVAEL